MEADVTLQVSAQKETNPAAQAAKSSEPARKVQCWRIPPGSC